MSLINFSDWRASLDESSPLTRQRDQWGRYGNYPVRADFMSRSTPLPAFVDKLKKELGTTEHPKKHKKHKKHKSINEAKKSPAIIHTDMDSWLKEIEALKKDLDEFRQVKEKSDLDKKKKALELARKKRDVFADKEEKKSKESSEDQTNDADKDKKPDKSKSIDRPNRDKQSENGKKQNKSDQ